MSGNDLNQFLQFYQCILGILITCLVCFRMKQFKCPLCPLSHFCLFFSGGDDETNKVSLFSINGAWKCSHFFSQWGEEFEDKANYDCACKDLTDMYCPNLFCIEFHFVDSRFVRYIFIWRCQRTPTRPDPSPAKSLFRESSWQQVELPKIMFGFWIKLIRKVAQTEDLC